MQEPLSPQTFADWFSTSQAIDSLGKPLVLYHGTNAEFTRFDANHIGESQDGKLFAGRGFYFSPIESDASDYGAKVMRVYLRMQKTLDLRDKNEFLQAFKNLIPVGQEKPLGQLVDEYREAKQTLQIAAVMVLQCHGRPGFYDVQWQIGGEWVSSWPHTPSSLELSDDMTGRRYAECHALPPNPDNFLHTSAFSYSDITKAIMENGYDSAVNHGSVGHRGDEYIVFSADQIMVLPMAVVAEQSASDNVFHTPKQVAKLQMELATVEAKYEPLRVKKMGNSPEWEAIGKEAGQVRQKLFDLTGDWYGNPKVKKVKPSDEDLNASYANPDDVPEHVRQWIRTSSLLYSDATDAVRWGRITDTLNDDRYHSGDLTIYRAVDGDYDDIRPGDWVTTELVYAEDHLRKSLDGKGKILETTVDGRDVLISPTGNAEEAIYAPRDLSGPVNAQPVAPKPKPAAKPKVSPPPGVLYNDENDNAIVAAGNDYRISVNMPGNASYVVLWSKQSSGGNASWRKAGALATNERTIKIGGVTGNYLGVSSIEIDKSFRGRGLGLQMYRALIDHAAPDVVGITSHTPDRANKLQVPRIYARLGAVTHGDYQVIPARRELSASLEYLVPAAKQEVEPQPTVALVDDHGAPLVVYHGTTATRVIPGTTVQGDAQAQSELRAMAQQQGISDWTSVPSIFERWISMGIAEKYGVTQDLATHARELYERSKPTITRHTVALAFDVFEFPGDGKELGVHFGTHNQAIALGEAFPFVLSIKNPLRLPDLGNWGYQSVMRDARKCGVPISEAEYDTVFNANDNNAALRDLLTLKGYDGVVYKNEAEGHGDSYIAFYHAQIKPTTGLDLSVLMQTHAPAAAMDAAELEEMQRRCDQIPKLRNSAGPAYTFWQAAQAAIQEASGHTDMVDWSAVEQSTIETSIRAKGQHPSTVQKVLSLHSPGAVTAARQEAILEAASAVFEAHCASGVSQSATREDNRGSIVVN